jgi:PIN domain nuclease of toxin-antitoxin system
LRLLLDTHAALWWAADDERLTDRAGELLEDPESEVLVSAVVVWEAAIKRSVGKLDALDTWFEPMLDAGAAVLPVTIEHAAATAHLPWHHRDPFDRLLVAQAQVENATLVSRDSELSAYGVVVAW